jgi:hypothetical protein
MQKECPLNLVQSNIGLLRVFEPIEYRDWELLGGERGMTASLMRQRS